MPNRLRGGHVKCAACAMAFAPMAGGQRCCSFRCAVLLSRAAEGRDAEPARRHVVEAAPTIGEALAETRDRVARLARL